MRFVFVKIVYAMIICWASSLAALISSDLGGIKFWLFNVPDTLIDFESHEQQWWLQTDNYKEERLAKLLVMCVAGWIFFRHLSLLKTNVMRLAQTPARAWARHLMQGYASIVLVLYGGCGTAILYAQMNGQGQLGWLSFYTVYTAPMIARFVFLPIMMLGMRIHENLLSGFRPWNAQNAPRPQEHAPTQFPVPVQVQVTNHADPQSPSAGVPYYGWAECPPNASAKKCGVSPKKAFSLFIRRLGTGVLATGAGIVGLMANVAFLISSCPALDCITWPRWMPDLPAMTLSKGNWIVIFWISWLVLFVHFFLLKTYRTRLVQSSAGVWVRHLMQGYVGIVLLLYGWYNVRTLYACLSGHAHLQTILGCLHFDGTSGCPLYILLVRVGWIRRYWEVWCTPWAPQDARFKSPDLSA